MPDRSPTVAVIDDEAQMLVALGRLIKSRGYEVALFGDGKSLLAAVPERTIDCIVLDLHMPGLSGFSILETLSGMQLHPPVILITGHDEPGNLERSEELGAVRYLLKPVDASPLMEAIQHCVAVSAGDAARSH